MSKKRKKHTLEDRLKYMKMLEEGYSTNYIHQKFGIDHIMIESLWIRYQNEGPRGLIKKQYIRTDGAFREKVLRDIEENHLTLHETVVKYNISANNIFKWRRLVKADGYEALYNHKLIGRPRQEMGRPKKKKPEEMTELEVLQLRVKELEAENALLKKVKALVEEREARLREIGRKPSKN